MRVWKITENGCVNGAILDIVTSDDHMSPQQVFASWLPTGGAFFGAVAGRGGAIEAWHAKSPSKTERLQQLRSEIAHLLASDDSEGGSTD
jgi:hypothetical protein